MKVKCRQFLDEETGDVLDQNSWLTIGRIYHVLSIHMEFGGRLKFQLVGDDGLTPAFHDAGQFEVVSCLIPSTWCVSSVPGSHFELTPKAWLESGFWEEYFDGNVKAIALFQCEKEKMLEEEDSQ
ncbi:hypothetical protein [Thiolapillus sp.]|uniref:hypothetical protein n=2 Tax=Thiolapillus sp. TaxID=2017437 RepID=UPI0025F6CBCA|nr:hypothetical protein [Thiolapillus sp.]